ncbi:MAG: alanine-zipper protein [Gammaproteobacteria bacterium]
MSVRNVVRVGALAIAVAMTSGCYQITKEQFESVKSTADNALSAANAAKSAADSAASVANSAKAAADAAQRTANEALACCKDTNSKLDELLHKKGMK